MAGDAVCKRLLRMPKRATGLMYMYVYVHVYTKKRVQVVHAATEERGTRLPLAGGSNKISRRDSNFLPVWQVDRRDPLHSGLEKAMEMIDFVGQHARSNYDWSLARHSIESDFIFCYSIIFPGCFAIFHEYHPLAHC